METLRPTDDRKRVQVVEGQKFQVELPEAPVTGFRWVAVEIPPEIRALMDEFEAPADAVPGASGIRRWKFEAVRRGTGRLRLQLAARTPRSGAPKVFTAVIEVTGD